MALPCRGFAAAQTVTDSGGEIIVLDSAGYGVITITKSISIIAPVGVYAGISVLPGNNGITIATPGVSVVLRGLTIKGQGGNDGINMTAGFNQTAGVRLTVENCVISNLTQSGINVAGATTVRVMDTVVRDNGLHGIFLQNGARTTIARATVSSNGFYGIFALGTFQNTTTIVDVANSTIEDSGNGVFGYSETDTAAVKVSVRESQVVRNSNYGLVASSLRGASVSLSASNNIVSNNRSGIGGSSAGTKVWVSGNTVSDNSVSNLFSGGFINFDALFESAGNNSLRNNGVDTFGTITVVTTK